MTQKQGIVSILGSDSHEKMTKAAPLRRTLSADMSSKRWLAQNGLSFCAKMKKIASSDQIAMSAAAAHDSSSSEEDEEECEANTKGVENPRQLDIWTAIMLQKTTQDESGKLPPPYVHPLVKKSASSLSEKSLKICTESLGSETGSDVFSSYPSTERGDENKGHEQQQEEEETKEPEGEEPKVAKPPHLATKKALQARSFPPPLPSLAAARMDGPSLHMHSHRVDGHLVLEAVSVPSQNYFEAQRQDGCFLLTLINSPDEQPSKNNQRVEFQDVFGTFVEEKSQEPDNDEDEEEEDEIKSSFSDKDMGILKEQAPNSTGGVINVHRSTMMMKRIGERDNRNPSWSRKLNNKAVDLVKLEVVKEEAAAAKPPPPPSPITQSVPAATQASGLPPLPPPPPPPATTSFNSYQHFWRVKPTVASVIDPLITQHRPPTKNKDLVLLRGNKADCFLPSLKGCKKPRRSLLMWEPYCIATS